MFTRTGLISTLAAATAIVEGVTIADIQGNSFVSTYNGKTVQDLVGVVTAKAASGIYIQDNSSTDARVSSGLYIFGSSIVNKTAIGDKISVSGKISEYRSDPNYLFTTELTVPTNLTIISSGNIVKPIILGEDRSPPTWSMSALDAVAGPDGWLSVPNNQSQVTKTNSVLEPEKHGLDFWSSLEGMLVTVRKPVALNFENQYGEFWVRGDWESTGINGRGGLTITYGPDGLPDANPEAILIDNPLDKTKNPATSLGMTFSDITGIVNYSFGFWYLAPLTAPTVVVKPAYNPPASPFTPEEDECSLLVGAYNVENMNPKSKHIPTVAKHIVEFLKTPDVMLLQEIQDNNGETDDGTVSANLTLATLATAIVTAGGKFNYSFVDIAPVNDQDGGAPGGNIRTAYLYNPAKVSLVPGRAGGALEATEVVVDSAGNVGLSLNPGRIEPTSEAWNSSRKPLVANWQTVSGERFFTIDVHFASKGGSSSGQGDARPPVNGVVGPRTNQVTLTANFMKSILAADKDASILVGGDMNEYIQTRSVFKPFEGVVQDLDAVAGIPEVERYSYTFDQNTQELDHTFVSAAIAARKPKFEHIHVNTWSPSYKERTSDHDPSVASIKVCTNLQKYTGALGGIYAPAVTKRGNRYYTKGEASLLLVTARTRSCNRQLSACTTLSKTGAVKWTGCATQEAKCLAAMVF